MIKGRFVEQQIEPRYSPGGGVDYGAEGKILLVYKKMRVLWRKGHHYWSALFTPWSYARARLEIRDDTGKRLRSDPGLDLIEGGRLTLNRIDKVLPKIRKLLALRGLRMKHFDLKKTFVVNRVEGKK